jgi:hypothetical protein
VIPFHQTRQEIQSSSPVSVRTSNLSGQRPIPAVQDPNGKYIPVTIDENDLVYLGIEVIGSLNFGGASLLGTPTIYQAAVVFFSTPMDQNDGQVLLFSAGSVAINAIEIDPFS